MRAYDARTHLVQVAINATVKRTQRMDLLADISEWHREPRRFVRDEATVYAGSATSS